MRVPARIVSGIIIAFICSCTPSSKNAGTSTNSLNLPPVEREFRAAWVATVANINWPSKPGLPVDSQQKEALKLLDFLEDHHFNAVILQVRPQADALYKSELEPWSYFLTGTQGKAPEPFYDPLQFWIDESHKRGLELHVWLNPYRAHHISGGTVSDQSIVKKKPELVLHLKEGYWWFDPAKKGTQDHSTAVVMDIVKRYDIDGVHFDDYFYPYPSYNLNEDFPDNESWNQYQSAGGKLSRGDWRRDAVNTFIKNLYDKIKKEKNHVKFGLSPFGIWRPGHPASVSGFDQYDVLYADAKLWLNEGWIDYFSPQLYWPISRVSQSFPVLLGWWAEENKKGRHLWPGMSVGRDTSVRSVNETTNQIMITRGMLPQSMGAIHWSISSVVLNPKLSKALVEGAYAKQALVPASSWLDNTIPAQPSISLDYDSVKAIINWQHKEAGDIFQTVLYMQYGTRWTYKILPANAKLYELPVLQVLNNGTREALNNVAVAGADRTGNLGPAANMELIHTLTLDEKLYPRIIPRVAWNAAPPRPYPQQVPVKITIHHEGTVLEAKDDATRKIKNIQTWGMGPDRNWTDIPYHFLIAPDGKIYEGRAVSTVGETATEYNPAGHLLICCLGNLETQPLPEAQFNSLVKLVAYTSKKYGIPLDSIAAHKDFSNQTNCPGKNLYPFIQNGTVKNKAAEIIAAAK